MSQVALIVIAKQPRPGFSKTRLCPPATPSQAADLAEAALADTLAAVASVPRRRRVLVLDGARGPWLPPGFEVIAQSEGGLEQRLAAAFEAVGGPALLVGMDTPQLSRDLLTGSAAALTEGGADAVIGPARDGGYWAIGLHDPDPRVFERIPMSSSRTCEAQLERLGDLGLRVKALESLEDVDTIASARAVAALCPRSRFAAALSNAGLDAVDDRPPRPDRTSMGAEQWASA